MATKLTQYRKVASAQFEQRREPRHPVYITRASVRQHGEEPVEAQLSDLSSYGCRVTSPGTHIASERLWLRFEGSMPIAATVVWSEKGAIGCRFDEPIARSLLRSLTLRAA